MQSILEHLSPKTFARAFVCAAILTIILNAHPYNGAAYAKEAAIKPPKAVSGAGKEPPLSTKAESVELAFPKDYSMGSLYLLKPPGTPGDWDKKFYAQACGKFAVPRGTTLELQVSYEACKDFSTLNRLPPGIVTCLSFEGLEIGDKEFKTLTCLPSLKGLSIIDIDLTNQGFMLVQNCHSLEKLVVKGTLINGKALAAVRNLYTLKKLDFELCDLDDDSISNLAKLPGLHTLSLRSVKIGDAGVAHLQALTSLVKLSLSVNHITDAGIKHLEPLKNLDHLDLRATKITAACSKTLKTLPRLQSVRISYFDFTPDAIQAMKRDLPKCYVMDGKDANMPAEIFAPLH